MILALKSYFRVFFKKTNYCCLDSLEELLCVSKICETTIVVCKRNWSYRGNINLFVLCIEQQGRISVTKYPKARRTKKKMMLMMVIVLVKKIQKQSFSALMEIVSVLHWRRSCFVTYINVASVQLVINRACTEFWRYDTGSSVNDRFIAGSLEAAYSLNWGAREIWGKGGGETLALLW